MNKIYEIKLSLIILETLQDIPSGVPEGHLYSALMSKVSLDEFKKLIDTLKASEAIKVGFNFVGKGQAFETNLNLLKKFNAIIDYKLQEIQQA